MHDGRSGPRVAPWAVLALAWLRLPWLRPIRVSGTFAQRSPRRSCGNHYRRGAGCYHWRATRHRFVPIDPATREDLSFSAPFRSTRLWWFCSSTRAKRFRSGASLSSWLPRLQRTAFIAFIAKSAMPVRRSMRSTLDFSERTYRSHPRLSRPWMLGTDTPRDIRLPSRSTHGISQQDGALRGRSATRASLRARA